jgi:hypothetical protein
MNTNGNTTILLTEPAPFVGAMKWKNVGGKTLNARDLQPVVGGKCIVKVTRPNTRLDKYKISDITPP